MERCHGEDLQLEPVVSSLDVVAEVAKPGVLFLRRLRCSVGASRASQCGFRAIAVEYDLKAPRSTLRCALRGCCSTSVFTKAKLQRCDFSRLGDERCELLILWTKCLHESGGYADH